MRNFGQIVGGVVLAFGLSTNPGAVEAKKKTKTHPVTMVIDEKCAHIMYGNEVEVACSNINGDTKDCEYGENLLGNPLRRCTVEVNGVIVGIVYQLLQIN